MAIVVQDSFTGASGTSITSHVGEVGAAWSLGAGFVAGNVPVIDSTGARVRAGSATGTVVFASGVAVADGESAEVAVDWVTVAAAFGVMTRAGNISGAAKGYLAAFTGTDLTIFRLDSSTFLATISAATAYVPAAGPHTYKIEAVGTGASVTVNVYADGTLIKTGTDNSANRLTTFGSCGLYFDTTVSDSAGPHISSIVQADPSIATSGLTLTSPAAGRVFQRAGATGAISVTGTYTGSPAAIEARLVLDGTSTPVSGFDWSTKVASPAAGAFSFSFVGAPEGTWYNVQIRDSAVPATVTTSGKVGVGALVVLIGQSNAYLWFARGDSTLTPDPKLRVIGSGSDNGIASVNAAKSWAVPDSATMNACIAFGNRLASALNTLVGVVDVTWDGSGLTVTGNGGKWIPTATAGQPYARAKAFLQTITSAIEAAVIVNGETDALMGVTQSDFYTAMGVLISTLRADFGAGSTPIVTPLLGKRTTGGVTDAQAQAVRNAQVQKALDAAVYRVEREDLSLNADGVHLDPTGFTRLGQRCAQAVLFDKGAATFYRGPKIASVVRVNPTVFDVLLVHGGGTDISPGTGITGFRVLDGATPVTLSSVVRKNASAMRITTSTAPSALPTIQYLWGTSPTVTSVAVDNSALALPIEFNDGVVAAALATSATVTLQDRAGTLRANLTAMKWAFFDQVNPGLLAAPTAQGTSETTDASGTMVLDIAGTSLTPGALGWLVVSNSDGTVNTSDVTFSGPVVVA